MKFFFDNNLSRYLAHGIRELSAVTPEVEEIIHLTDRFARDAPDLTWIGELSNDGPWYIISIDRFKNSMAPNVTLSAGPVAPFSSWTGNGPDKDFGSNLNAWSDGGHRWSRIPRS